MDKPTLVVIVGPTASGKTALAISMAKQFSGEVISADSRQIYQDLDIGTEKVTADEMDGVPHHLLDVAAVGHVYSAADYKRDAAVAIDEITARGHLPIIAGGTFFYIDTLLERISPPAVAPNNTLRQELTTKTTAELFAQLKAVDPERAKTIEPHNPRRLIRALEVATELGAVPKSQVNECPYRVLMIGIRTDKNALRARLRARAAEALSRGLIEETQSLLAAGVSHERLSEIGLEYRVVLDYLDGTITSAELIQKLEEKNWQYAKRQLTWLKRDQSIVWFKRENLSEIFTLIRQFLEC